MGGGGGVSREPRRNWRWRREESMDMEMVIWWNAPSSEERKEENIDKILQEAWTKQKETFRNMALTLVACS